MPNSASPYDEPTSLGLIADARRRLPDAWKRIHQMYGPLVYTWCRDWKVPEQDALDLVQDVFRNVIRRLDTFQHGILAGSTGTQGTFRGWIWTITRNRVRDYWRVNQRHPAAVGGTDMQQQILQIPEWSLESNDDAVEQLSELARQILRLIQTEFEERTWTAFWQLVVEGQAIYHVAHKLEMSEGAVRQAKYRVLRRVREELESVG